jgi:hypothetical protein
MAKTFTAPFAQTVNNSNLVLTTATTGITTDSVANVALLYTAGTEGSLVTSITAIPRATVTATVIYLFVSSDNGTTSRLIDSILMPAQTLSTTTAVAQSVFTNYTEDYPLRLKANERLYAAISVALTNGIVIAARGMDY